jgi:hypothetical protein
MLRQLILTFLVMFWDVQCHAFKRSQRSALVIPSFLEGDLHIRTGKCHRQLSSIRGGGDDNDENNLDDNAAYLEFIASFESELAEIRLEAETEVENEMKKLRSLFERDGDVEAEDETKYEYDQVAIEDGNGQEEKLDASPNGDQLVITSEEVLPEDGDTIDQPHIESDSEDGKDDKTLHDNGIELDDDTCMISDITPESDDAATDAGEESDTRIFYPTTISTESKVNGIKAKSLKRKTKASKKGKKRVKEIRNFYEDMESSDVGGHDDFGDAIMLSHKKTDDVAPSLQSGIWVFVRSDLGKALGLFIATVLLAIITTRLQRQMELEAVSGIH